MNSFVSAGVGRRHVKCTVCCDVIPPSQQGHSTREIVVCVSCIEENAEQSSNHLVLRRDVVHKRKRSQTEGPVVDLTSDGSDTDVMMMTGEPILSILLKSEKVKHLKTDVSTNKLELEISSSLRRRKMLYPRRFVPLATNS